MKWVGIVLGFLLFASNEVIAQKQTNNFVFFGLERERIHDTSFLNNEELKGAQLKYIWRELELSENQYALQLIQNDLDFLASKGKKLFIQLQDVNFDTSLVKPVPDYLIYEKKYHGGVSLKYDTRDDDIVTGQNGYVARRWDKAVADRFFNLLKVLGKQFDGKIEGINLPETAVGFGETGKLYPEGFTPDVYRDAMQEYMKRAKIAFPRSVVIIYANFMPGEWLPENNKFYLESLFAFAKKIGAGMGGPDIQIYNKAQMNHSYNLLKEYASELVTGVAVQEGNYQEINPMTGKRVTVAELYDFAHSYLGLDYVFWCTQEPFYSNELLPFLKEFAKQ